MKDIQSLYYTAKTSKRQSDIDIYLESVHYLLENNPSQYMSNLEYIISSSIGLKTLNEFVDRYGVSVSIYPEIMTLLESNIKKCKLQGVSDTPYQDAKHMMESMRQKFSHSFILYESYQNTIDSNYKKFYYERKIPLINKLDQLYSKYGMAVIPDIIIECCRNNTTDKLVSLFAESNLDAEMNQWIVESFKDIPEVSDSEFNIISERSLENIVLNIKRRTDSIFRESVLTNNSDMMIEYTIDEIDHIRELIAFKEYMITCLEDVTETLDIQSQVYSLYEQFGELLEEDVISEFGVADSIVPMLPGHYSRTINEKWTGNTSNKKTGNAPDYLKTTHDLGYGEDDPPKKTSIEDPEEPTLDMYRRPSSVEKKTGEDILNDKDVQNKIDDINSSNKSTDEKREAIRNYYNYTYNYHNSLNKHQVDDHSNNKRIHSDNNIDRSHPKKAVNHENTINESAPWELNIDTYLEGFPNIFSQGRSTSTSKASKVYTNSYLPVSQSDKEMIIKNIKELKQKIDIRLISVFNKYPIYGLTSSIGYIGDDLEDAFIVLQDDPNNPGKQVFIDGIKIEDGQFNSDLTITISGYELWDFMEILKEEYPDEIERLRVKYDVDNRADVSAILYTERICGYDKELYDIMDEVTHIIKNEFPMIHDFSDWGDYKSGPLYGGHVHLKFLYPDFDPSKLQKASWTYTSGLSSPIKHMRGIHEAVGDTDDNKPTSTAQDILTDIDKNLSKKQQTVKKKVQDVQNIGRGIVKPFKRMRDWISNMVAQWKDLEENRLKEKMADPHQRSNLFRGIKKAIEMGSLAKAGVLLNPVFLFLSITKGIGRRKKEFRIRNEMIAELKTELEIINEKISDAGARGEIQSKYKLMRLKNELTKKLIRVGGTPDMKKII